MGEREREIKAGPNRGKEAAKEAFCFDSLSQCNDINMNYIFSIELTLCFSQTRTCRNQFRGISVSLDYKRSGECKVRSVNMSCDNGHNEPVSDP